MRSWTDPRYIDMVAEYDANKPLTMGNCSNCGGLGRTIVYGSDGKPYSVTCQRCGGSGQA